MSSTDILDQWVVEWHPTASLSIRTYRDMLVRNVQAVSRRESSEYTLMGIFPTLAEAEGFKTRRVKAWKEAAKQQREERDDDTENGIERTCDEI
jgi:hypothetical protein